MISLARLPRYEIAAFFLYLLLWPILTGNVLLILINTFYPKSIPDMDTWLLALIPELTAGLLPSTCLAVAIVIVRRTFQGESTVAGLSSFMGGAVAGVCGALWGLSGFLLMGASGICAAAACALLLNIAGFFRLHDQTISN